MASAPTFDRASFQQLLADAYAVQASQVDSRSLSAIFEVHRLVTKGRLNLDGAMRQIAKRTQLVANASGVAVGLLNGNQLVYRAESGNGSGIRIPEVGRQAIAELVVSPSGRANHGVLKVEDSRADEPVAVEICQQLGARSLVLVLIYRDRVVAGVLQIFFREAHAFQEREVRTYQLMAGVIGEAISRWPSLEQRQIPASRKPAVDLSTMHSRTAERLVTERKAQERLTTQLVAVPVASEEPKAAAGPAFHSSNTHPAPQPCLITTMVAEEPLTIAPAKEAKSIALRVKIAPWRKYRADLALPILATGLLLTGWSAYGYRPSGSAGSWTAQRMIVSEPQGPRVLAPPVPANSASTPKLAPVRAKRIETAAKSAGPAQRVQVSENEVKIGDDVTVRYFTAAPKPKPAKAGRQNQVVYVGDDVTIRYFAPRPTSMPNRRPSAREPQPEGNSGSASSELISQKPTE